MTSFRNAQQSYDNESPPESDHDYTENMTESEFRAYLRVYFDMASVSVQEQITDFINERKAREVSENYP